MRLQHAWDFVHLGTFLWEPSGYHQIQKLAFAGLLPNRKASPTGLDLLAPRCPCEALSNSKNMLDYTGPLQATFACNCDSLYRRIDLCSIGDLLAEIPLSSDKLSHLHVLQQCGIFAFAT